MRPLLKLISIALLVISYCVGMSQDLKSILHDPKMPQKIKAADLGDEMQAIKITYEKQGGGGGDIFSMMMNPMMMLMGAFGQSTSGTDAKPADPNEAAGLAFFDKMSISWTSGATIQLYGQEFLVTYAPQLNMAEVMKSKSPPDMGKSDLVLTLINTKSIASITPRPDMTKAEWLKAAPVIPPAEKAGSGTVKKGGGGRRS
jgi:hypothetical protein